MSTKTGARPPSCFQRQKIKHNVDTKIDLPYYQELQDFTKDLPKIEIGHARKPPPPIELTPGPGDYDPPPSEKDTRISHKIVETPRYQERSITAGIDFINNRVFPRVLKTSIGVRDGKHFYSSNELMTPSYFTHSSFENRPITIGNKIPIKDETASPGPKYKITAVKPRAPAFTMSGPKRRTLWMYPDGDSDAPPPATYDLAPLSQGVGYTIGHRSRCGKQKKFSLIPIGTFIAKVDASIPQQEAEEFIAQHKEVREMIEFALNSTLKEKPQNVKQFLFDLFTQYQEKHGLKKKKSKYL
ncbi:hypothetical protein TVAG_059580 [Trichomonas vaginalis G3]|uniref:Uncharacterized protein n=1 Tax=Trichomonas vaginalis (strain ATCC PRA-98 / G3) TaxID=412133 RepID=A2FB10_TRIV3|nr:hypothetical protein TVAGG3_0710220 [Trichomonas vaginalis G3]EAX97893.1 hypothetical protein TVAG_059580 [Trichomonas vaginalis G3]KAI5509844.1 hypothetical protein TVAGG3_0710220 [Trichomonas vaginalis G3]|eukprot:XP_001310823.1 hypothetical protein [Trichomonas vaginalis G3]